MNGVERISAKRSVYFQDFMIKIYTRINRMIRHRLRMQFRMLLFAAISLLGVALARSQPGPCDVDSDCHLKYFCETSVGECHPCLSCQTLMREPPSTPNSCIKSVRECGLCLKGLVVDLHSDLTCMPSPGTTQGVDESPESNTVVWSVVSIIVFLSLIGVAAVIVYCVDRFKKSNRGDDDIMTATPLQDQFPPTAPTCEAPPPPYWTSYYQSQEQKADEDRPLVSLYRLPEYEPHNIDYQNAGLHNPPNWVRLPIYPTDVNGNIADENGSNSPPSLTADNNANNARTPEQQNDTDGNAEVNPATSPPAPPPTPPPAPGAQPPPAGDESASANELTGPLADLIQSQPLCLELSPVNGEDGSSEENTYGSAQPPQDACLNIVMSMKSQLKLLVKPRQSAP